MSHATWIYLAGVAVVGLGVLLRTWLWLRSSHFRRQQRLETREKIDPINTGSPVGDPSQLTTELGLESIPGRSPLAWSVPGCVSGWQALSGRFGALPLSRCLEPGIHYASAGFPVSPIIAGHFAWVGDDSPDLVGVYHPGGQVPGFGDIFRNPALAESYRAIAKGGAAAFYEGDIAKAIAKFHRGHNPHPELPYLCIGICLTPPDREHVTNSVERPW